MGIVAKGDEDLRLSLPYAVAADRRRLAAIFALQVELRRIPDLVSEPPLGEIRFQWWREALEEIIGGGKRRAHPIVEALAATGAVDPKSLPLFERLIDARARLLYGPAFALLDDYRSFIADAEAPLGELALKEVDGRARNAIAAMSEAYALARFAPTFASQCAKEAARKSLQLLEDSRHGLSSLPAALAGRVIFLALTRGYSARPDGRPWPLAKRSTMFHAMLTGKF